MFRRQSSLALCALTVCGTVGLVAQAMPVTETFTRPANEAPFTEPKEAPSITWEEILKAIVDRACFLLPCNQTDAVGGTRPVNVPASLGVTAAQRLCDNYHQNGIYPNLTPNEVLDGYALIDDLIAHVATDPGVLDSALTKKLLDVLNAIEGDLDAQ